MLDPFSDESQIIPHHEKDHTPAASQAEKLAGLESKQGRDCHPLRRKFASDLMDQPLNALCELGGWEDAQAVPRCFALASLP